MRIYTWNMEHGSDRWTYLNQHTDADALCLQETSNARFANFTAAVINNQNVFEGDLRLGSTLRGVAMKILIAHFGVTGQNSCGVAVPDPTPAPAPASLVIAPPNVSTRATPGLQLPALHNNVWVFSIHAPSTQGNAWQMAWIGNVLTAIAANGGNWICAGDYNATPDSVQAVCPPGAVVVSPDGPTHRNGGTLDFAVASAAGLLTSATVLPGNISDHWPVKLEGP